MMSENGGDEDHDEEKSNNPRDEKKRKVDDCFKKGLAPRTVELYERYIEKYWHVYCRQHYSEESSPSRPNGGCGVYLIFFCTVVYFYLLLSLACNSGESGGIL